MKRIVGGREGGGASPGERLEHTSQGPSAKEVQPKEGGDCKKWKMEGWPRRAAKLYWGERRLGREKREMTVKERYRGGKSNSGERKDGRQRTEIPPHGRQKGKKKKKGWGKKR